MVYIKVQSVNGRKIAFDSEDLRGWEINEDGTVTLCIAPQFTVNTVMKEADFETRLQAVRKHRDGTGVYDFTVAQVSTFPQVHPE